MPSERKPGMDHAHYPWSPLPWRAPLRWPDGSNVLVCPLILLEHYDDIQPEGAVRSTWLAGGLGDRPLPNYPRHSHREYGHRVGIHRLLEAFESRGLRPSIAIDAETAKHYPDLGEICRTRAAEVIAHGRAVTRIISSEMSEAQERRYIADCLEDLAHHGLETRGWLGAEYSESERTPQLLADAGVEFVCDWCNDEQPFAMSTTGSPLVAVPLMADYDDAFALFNREVRLETYEDMLSRGLRTLCADGARTGRVMAFAIRPWLLGQPFRLGILERFLDEVLALEGASLTTLAEVMRGWQLSAGEPAAS